MEGVDGYLTSSRMRGGGVSRDLRDIRITGMVRRGSRVCLKVCDCDIGPRVSEVAGKKPDVPD